MISHTIRSMIEVRLVLDETLCTVMADPTQFEMALLNLAAHAREAMLNGDTLTISTANIVAASPDLPEDLAPGNYAHMSIQDNGFGLTADVAFHVFEPFYTTKEVGKGTELGLSQVYGFSKQRGGTTMLSSIPGHGTCVDFRLPHAPEPETVSSTTSVLPASPLADLEPNGTRVLVIDDEADVRNVTVKVLRALGFDVIAAESAPSGVEVLGIGRPIELVVTDFSMPEMNGVEFIRLAQLGRPELPCLLVTGYVNLGSVPDALPAEPPPILRKPYRMSELSSTSDQMLTEAPARSRGIANKSPTLSGYLVGVALQALRRI